MIRTVFALFVLLIADSAMTSGNPTKRELAAQTEVWEPQPQSVETPLESPPGDAIVLLGRDNAAAWQSVEQPKAALPWHFKDGVMTVVPGSGDIQTRQAFCDVQLHIEWRTPEKIANKSGQQLGNSGVFLQQRYEIQILDSYANRTYSNGQAASVYKQAIPLVNASRPPQVWQQYDIIFRAPRFNGDGDLLSPAMVTVFHNGVLVQDHVVLKGSTVYIGEPRYEAHGCAPIQLQDHKNTVSFRNIWVREL